MNAAHVYHLHLTDPVTFHNSINFILEGNNTQNVTKLEELSYPQYLSRRSHGQVVQSHLVLYYSRKCKEFKVIDQINIGNFRSEQQHDLKLYINRTKVEPTTLQPFYAKNVKFFGNTYNNSTETEFGRHFPPKSLIFFKMRLPPDGATTVVLRRLSYARKFVTWNSEAKVYINGEAMGPWYIPKGSVEDTYTLQENDFMLNLNSILLHSKQFIEIRIETLTSWRDISYTLLLMC